MKEMLFDPRIFWDMNNIDYQKTPMSVIFRVVRYGNRQDFKNLRKIYSSSILQTFLEKRGKELDQGEKKLFHLLIKSCI